MQGSSPPRPVVFRFGVFDADARAGELRKSGVRVRMQEQPFQILVMLLERPAEVVTREEIRQKLWPGDVFVDFEHGVNSAVARLREVLGDSADRPRYVETLPRRGYRFIAQVDAAPPAHSTRTGVQGTENGNGAREAVVAGKWTPAAETFAAQQPVAPAGKPGTFSAQSSRRAVLAAALAVAALAAGAYFYFQSTHALTEADSIVLADFANATSDSVFDSALRQALAVKLGESPFLSIVSEQRMRDTLGFMGRSPDERFTAATSREICQRLGSKALLTGQVSQLADHYYILLEAFNCASGDSIARAGAEAASKPETLRALDVAAAEIRRKLGESLSSIQKYDAPIEQATTTSLEALKAFSLGQAKRNGGNELSSIPLFERAIELDPDFAMAYAVLGQVYANREQGALAADYTRKAFERRQRAGEQERFYISTHYYDNVTRELAKSAETYELWQQTYPRDVVPRINLTDIYHRLGEHEKALAEILEALRLDPNRAAIYGELIDSYICLDRLSEAKASYGQSLAHGFSGDEDAPLKRYVIAFLENDATTMGGLAKSSAGKPFESTLLTLEASTAAFSGRLRSAEDLFERAEEISGRENPQESTATWQALEALTEAEYDRPEQAQHFARLSEATARTHDAEILAALALARSGDAARAQALARELLEQYPNDTLLNSVWLPTIRAQLELLRGDANGALRLLASAAPYELGESEPLPSLFPAFLRGEAYLQLGDGKSAAAEFQKVLDHPGIAGSFLHGALARLGQARARALVADVSGGRQSYQEFLAQWKNADPQTPILRQAKAEYAKLR
jgi:DNA-binding winged helix-turn-helix (wHTH) protein/tetratricopeptide (TPR) repeat protein